MGTTVGKGYGSLFFDLSLPSFWVHFRNSASAGVSLVHWFSKEHGRKIYGGEGRVVSFSHSNANFEGFAHLHVSLPFPVPEILALNLSGIR